MFLLCLSNSLNEECLTTDKVYIGSICTEHMYEGWWIINKTDDGHEGFYAPDRFKELNPADIRVEGV